MAEIIVKVPNDRQADYDFIAFSYNGLHSFEDFGLIRTSDGSRYNTNFIPTMQDKTAEVPGGNGMYYFGTTYKQKDFPISFAFENMNEQTLQRMKSWLNGDGVYPLWFAEEPYKVYMAKVTGTPSLKLMPFEIDGERVYKGEGSVSFTAYNPFARTPDYVWKGWHEPELETTYTVLNPINGTTKYKLILTDDVEYPVSDLVMINGEFTTDFFNDCEIQNLQTIKFNTLGNIRRRLWLECNNIKTEVYLKDCPGLEDGRRKTSYTDFANYSQWIVASGLTDGDEQMGGVLPGAAKVEMYGWNEITEEEARK